MARTTIRTEDITASEVTTAKMAVDPTNASNLSSGSVPLAQLDNVDTTGITANKDDIALLGFKVAANGSLAKYNLVDQTIDAFEDASGIDASASTNEDRNAANYYSGVVTVSPTVSGNWDSTGTDGSDTWYKWTTVTSSGSYTTDTAQDYDFLVVAGGGGGGRGRGGGGGAGGYRNSYASEASGGGGSSEASLAVSAGTISGITVGGGGSAGPGSDQQGSPGSNSVFSTITSVGGGRGGAAYNNSSKDGGSGGGGSGQVTGGYSSDGGSGTANQGYDGASISYYSSNASAGGGAGSAASGNSGGSGLASSIDGSSTTRAGGGGGGGDNSSGSGGSGGGGNGAQNSGSAQNGTANTGSGGGGSGYAVSAGDGGSGIVIIRRVTSTSSVGDMTLVSNATTAQDGAPTTGDLVITYTDGAGTATANTDIKAYISRDGSAYTSAVTLVAQGTTGGHTILTANGVDLSGIATGTSMRWKITTHNQSAAKETRIQAVSLGWS